ncbi:pimeloyl-ACP methyl ester carboxylesterase [Murinocardiopsis flavida]|uniref:Pimeloyl-ACP methyl ester carboxylesterase n=1 Tax=Murinocardiopsis flavida TaxID=645275 RepID=A0A2P8DKE2_9ACTN|nr:alpha/beta hydrolase [Murinocardiopsis flavida]PSK97686.1 pimeloyl-ACP methyl ester carboxylesterase [Murinocardiopsis flavida]
MAEPTTRSLEVPGAVLRYDVRGTGSDAAPALLMIASPMDAAGFTTLAGYFPDRTVVTYDPRGTGRSERSDGVVESTPDEHADDLHRLIAALGGGPVDIFASSGGAVNAFALVARHPELVRTLVAHEPPLAQVLPDCGAVLAASMDIHRTYQRRGLGPAMAKFIALTGAKGPIPADFAHRPAPDPAEFGLPAEDDGSRDDPMIGQNMLSCIHFQPDFDALRAAPTRIVLGVGTESAEELTGRSGAGVAGRLGTAAVTFPSHHGGFGGGEFGMKGEPDAFAATLRRILAEQT